MSEAERHDQGSTMSTADVARAALIAQTWAPNPGMIRIGIDQLEQWANRGYEHESSSTHDDDLVDALHARGLGAAEVEALLAVIDATAVVARCSTGEDDANATSMKARGQALVGAMETLSRASARFDATMLSAAGQLTGVFGRLLLADKGMVSPEELTTRQRDQWRSRAKGLARTEIAAASGWGPGEVSDLVAVANAPIGVSQPMLAALGSGEAPWRLVRRCHRATAGLAHEDAAAIAGGLFGTDPAAAATERLDSTGGFTGRPWFHREFYRALDREVAKYTANDPERASESRERLLAESDVWFTIDETGVGSVGVRCGAVQAAAIADRIETAARRARKQGDQRSLGLLRATIATTLLMNGTVSEPSSEAPPGLERVLTGMPPAIINVLVPLDTLIPHARHLADPECPRHEAADTSPAIKPSGVAEVVGKHRHFLSAAQVRELALHPGSTVFRILTDPATGRYLERSTTAYRFDTSMRTHIQFGDLSCRAPGCTVPARWCQLDHVEEFGTPDGHTSEANGALLHTAHHQQKTERLWDAVMDSDRTITWTSMLGRIYRTKAHDYNQYSALLSAAVASVDQASSDPMTDSGPSQGSDQGSERSARIDRAIYAALAAREPGERTHEIDDVEMGLWSSAWRQTPEEFPGWELITLTHTDANGRRQYRPAPEVAGPSIVPPTVGTATTARTPDERDTPWAQRGDDPPPF